MFIGGAIICIALGHMFSASIGFLLFGILIVLLGMLDYLNGKM